MEIDNYRCNIQNYNGPPKCLKIKTSSDIQITDQVVKKIDKETLPSECKNILLNDCMSIQNCKEQCKIFNCGKFIDDFLEIYDPANICDVNL